MAIKRIVEPCFETSDGKLFKNERLARHHEGGLAFYEFMKETQPDFLPEDGWPVLEDFLRENAARILDIMDNFKETAVAAPSNAQRIQDDLDYQTDLLTRDRNIPR